MRLTGKSCEIHRYHHPKPLRVEYHHLVPRAWQRVWFPGKESPHDHSMAGKLWDETTIGLCPTGHSNVHAMLVQIMRNFERMTEGDEATRLHAAYKQTVREFGRDKDLAVSLMSPEMWLKHGGSLDFLVEVGQYGYGTVYERI